MNRVAGIVYASNQKRAEFPLAFVTQHLHWVDELWLFGGDEYTLGFMQALHPPSASKTPMVVQPSPVHVATRDDTVLAQNHAIESVLESSEAEYLCVVQADIWVTPQVSSLLRSWVDTGKVGAWDVCNVHFRLYCATDYDHYGCTLLHRDAPNRFQESSAFVEPLAHHLGGVNEEHTVDVGYLTPCMAYHKFLQWQKLCPDNQKAEYIRLYEAEDVTAAVRFWLRHMSDHYGSLPRTGLCGSLSSKLQPVHDWRSMIGLMDLGSWDEYEEIRSMILETHDV